MRGVVFPLSPHLSVYLHDEATYVTEKYSNLGGRRGLTSQAHILQVRDLTHIT